MYTFTAPGQPAPVVLHLTGGPHHGTMLLGAPVTDQVIHGGVLYTAMLHHDAARTGWLSHDPSVYS